ncbi:PQQ-dependent sugar dehydrogenase [Halorhodospira abdelmalekii]|uniref:PQQ-dependent sugar dehydrogenase n=1 Tax=Halorhodospira abdelmalekii TaxID=421629 RepID=UPI001904A802|nr:PQQ-dependent sugar dehydrogenase [Halorhodospira abdelmalekii]
MVEPIAGTPEVALIGQGGLLDVALHPDYPEQPWVYLSYSAAGEGGYATHVGRGELDLPNRELRNFEVLHVATPFVSGGGHFGSRLLFDAEQHLYVTVGDRRNRYAAQDLQSHHGKVLRLHADGRIPADNPFVEDDEALDAIFSYGHRNAQGMALHPESGAIWINEHGQRAGDEINILVAGGNFGWPIATYSREYSTGGSIGRLPPELPETIDPVHYWEDQAFPPSGMAFYEGEAFPEWQGDLFVGGLGRQYLARFALDGEQLLDEERLLEGHGWRIRDVRVGPHDGYVYVLVDAGSAPLLRLVPASDSGQ